MERGIIDEQQNISNNLVCDYMVTQYLGTYSVLFFRSPCSWNIKHKTRVLGN